jgi:hypothetical protein
MHPRFALIAFGKVGRGGLGCGNPHLRKSGLLRKNGDGSVGVYFDLVHACFDCWLIELVGKNRNPDLAAAQAG